MSQMKVLMVIPGKNSIGSLPSAHDQAEALTKLGVTVQKLLLRGSADPTNTVLDLFDLIAARSAFKPDLIHAQFGTITAFLCALLCPVPLIITFRGSDLNDSPGDGVFRNVLQKLLSQIAILRSRKIICVSEALISKMWWGRGKATVLTTGIDLHLFQPRDYRSTKHVLGWPEDEAIIVFNAGDNPPRAVKRWELAVAACDQLRTVLPNHQLKILDGSQSRSDVVAYLSAADCLLLTSRFEGSPDIVKEALACGLPVVSVDVGDVKMQLQGIASCVVSLADPNELSENLVPILTNRPRVQAQDRIHEFSLESVCVRLLEIYRETVKSKDGTPL